MRTLFPNEPQSPSMTRIPRRSRGLSLVVVVILLVVVWSGTGSSQDPSDGPGAEVCEESYEGEHSWSLSEGDAHHTPSAGSFFLVCTYVVRDSEGDTIEESYGLTLRWSHNEAQYFASCVERLAAERYEDRYVGSEARMALVTWADTSAFYTGDVSATDSRALASIMLDTIRTEGTPCPSTLCPDIFPTTSGPWVFEGGSPPIKERNGAPLSETSWSCRYVPEEQGETHTSYSFSAFWAEDEAHEMPSGANCPSNQERLEKHGDESRFYTFNEAGLQVMVSAVNPTDERAEQLTRDDAEQHALRMIRDVNHLILPCPDEGGDQADGAQAPPDDSTGSGADSDLQDPSGDEDAEAEGDTYTDEEIDDFLDTVLDRVSLTPEPHPVLSAFDAHALEDLDACGYQVVSGDLIKTPVDREIIYRDARVGESLVTMDGATVDLLGCSKHTDARFPVERLVFAPNTGIGLAYGEDPSDQARLQHILYHGQVKIISSADHHAARETLDLESMVSEFFTDSVRGELSGTELTLAVTDTGETVVDTHEGEVVVQDRAGTSSVVVPAGYRTQAAPGQAPSEPVESPAEGTSGAAMEDGGGLSVVWIVLAGAAILVGYWFYSGKQGQGPPPGPPPHAPPSYGYQQPPPGQGPPGQQPPSQPPQGPPEGRPLDGGPGGR